MNKFIEDNLCTIIIGDEKVPNYDGRIKTCGKRDGFYHDVDAAKQIIVSLDYEGYVINDVDFSNINETGFNLINKGHILFSNCSFDSKSSLGYLFVPDHITDKQIESLRLLENNLKEFSVLFLTTIDEENKEALNVYPFEGNFTVDSIVETNQPKIITKK